MKLRSILVYIHFTFYMIGIYFKKLRLNYIKKHKGEEYIAEYVHEAATKWAKYTLKIAGVKVDAKGLENIPEQPCCFVSNHQGNFDFLVMMATIDRPMGFIAKKEIRKLKFIADWMDDLKCVFIDRNDIRASLKAINQGAENLKEGTSMAIFPEGTRSKSSELGEFKKGSLKMALKAKCPIVPVTVDNSYKVFEDHDGWVQKGVIKLTVGNPIYVSELSREEQKNLVDIVRDEVKKNL